MGLVAPLAELIFFENLYRPFRGDVLFIGRQDIFLTVNALSYLLKKYRLDARPEHFLEYNSSRPYLISDKSFMSFFGIDSLSFLDVSDYEGADIIWDLGKPVSSELHNRFDVIYNGSCLDNMFNPAQAMFNLTRMLKPNGRIIHLEHANAFNGPYLMYSPGWFFDYYVQNGFADCKVYVGEFADSIRLFYGPWQLHYHHWKTNPLGDIPASGDERHYMLVVIAEKKADSTAEHQPIQSQYRRDQNAINEFEANLRVIQSAKRPVFGIRDITKRSPGPKLMPIGTLSHDLYNGNYPPLY